AKFKLEKILKGHTGIVTSVQFLPNGHEIFEYGIFYQENKPGHSVKYLPTRNMLVSCSEDRTIRLWDIASGKEFRKFEGHSNVVSNVDISPDGGNILSCSFDETIRIWNINSNAQYSPDGQMIVSASYDNTIGIWDVQSGRRLKTLEGHSDFVLCAIFSPSEESICIWDIQTRRKIQELYVSFGLMAVTKQFKYGDEIIDLKKGYYIIFYLTNVKSFSLLKTANINSSFQKNKKINK
ncbi:WD-40 repeat protein, partial [Reticulomyxa filosa]